MKISIVVEDKNKGTTQIPLTRNEISALYEVTFMVDAQFIEQLKINGIKNDFTNICIKIEHLINDIIHDGKTYMLDPKTGKTKLAEKKFWLVKKPKWKH